MSTLNKQVLGPPVYSKRKASQMRRSPTWLCWENTHEAREQAVDGSQHFGVSTRHTGSDATLQGLKATEDGWGLKDGQQETQHFQSRANISIVHLIRLLLGWRTQITHK